VCTTGYLAQINEEIPYKKVSTRVSTLNNKLYSHFYFILGMPEKLQVGGVLHARLGVVRERAHRTRLHRLGHRAHRKNIQKKLQSQHTPFGAAGFSIFFDL
jgi:hypothetical protein